MRKSFDSERPAERAPRYQEITERIVSQIEAGTLPWVQPWKGASLSLPRNASTERAYSGVNILLLWDALFAGAYEANQWLTFKQAFALGGCVRKGERGTTIVFADRFTPKDDGHTADENLRTIRFLRRFTVFNVAQCEGLPPDCLAQPEPVSHTLPIDAADELIRASGARFARGGDQAFYQPSTDSIRVPRQENFFEPINFYRTALHELTHWTGAPHRLNRDFSGRFGSQAYAFEELVAEIGSAFLCTQLGILPTVRHADYIASWLPLLKNDARAIVTAASAASKASDFLLSFTDQAQRTA
ncbi:MAG TPA: zincin-like metallopeptidase domain-containing protein [Rhodanobacter sp.]|nr:zincin-like metallopeptidase domain-containing protein [Rhodanobacter sp.]